MTRPAPSIAAAQPGATFVKQYDGLVEVEVVKAERLARVARRNGFTAPAVLNVDVDRQVITYEWFDGLTPLRTAYLEHTIREPDAEAPELFERVGRVLAHIHRDLTLDERVPWEAPATFREDLERRLGPNAIELLARTPQAFLHGDFGFGNVHLEERTGRIVVLDPSPNGYLTTHPSTFASIYLDVGVLSACLRGLVGPARFLQLRRDRIGALENAFLEGYERTSGARLDRRLVDGMGYAIAGTYLRARYTLPFIAPLALRMMFRDRP
jgi:hypothetical protein